MEDMFTKEEIDELTDLIFGKKVKSNNKLNDFIKLKMREIISDIVKRCEFEGTEINFVEDGFEVKTKYRIPDDFGKLYDKNGKELNIGDKVNIQVYFGKTSGEIKRIDIINSSIEVLASSGDVFRVDANKSEKNLT